MRWTPGEESPDIEDRRGEGGGGGGFGGFGLGPRHIGIGGFLVLLVLSLLFHRNFFALLGMGSDTSQPAPVPGSRVAGSESSDYKNDKTAQLVSFVLDDVQKTWEQEFAKRNRTYRHAKLVLFRDLTRSGCGTAESSTGPFYCPADERVYIDLGFYDELQNRFHASGEFAEAYVLAHEVGHHVQNLLGLERQMRQLQSSRPGRSNQLSVAFELQADCLAGVWAHSTGQRGILENGDIQSALGAAAAVGDDRLQKMATGTVHPESWTHGSSAQREQWFQTGYDSGDIDRCDTFSGR
jgi:predicted metalloprotease